MHIRRRVALVCGFCGDKAVSEALRELTGITSITWTVPIANERSLSPQETAHAATQAGMTQVIPMDSVAEAIEAATTWAQDNQGTVLICGSLYLVGEVLTLQGEGDTLDPGESHRAH